MGLLAIVVYGAILGVTVFAWMRGGPAERVGASFNLAAAILVEMAHRTTAIEALPLALLTVDGLLAAGFLVLALRYASLWMGAALVFQAIQFGLHATYLVGHMPFNITYARVNNIDSFGILLSLAIGVAAARRGHPASASHA